MPATFEIPARIQSRLDRKASPAPKQAEVKPVRVDPFPITNPCGVCGSRDGHKFGCPEDDTMPAALPPIEIIPIAEWAEYRAAHPELVFTGKFDLQGRPIWAAEERTR